MNIFLHERAHQEKEKKNIYRWPLRATDCTTTDTLNTGSTKGELLQLSPSKHHMVPMLLGESKLSQVIFRNCQLAKVPNVSEADTDSCSESSRGNSHVSILGEPKHVLFPTLF